MTNMAEYIVVGPSPMRHPAAVTEQRLAKAAGLSGGDSTTHQGPAA
jgi:hypothetical protein